MTRSPHEIAESIVRSKEWADGKFSTDGDLKEWAKLVALIEKALESNAAELQAEIARLDHISCEAQTQLMADRDRWRSIAEAMRNYVFHEPKCILSYLEAGEPTAGGGYRTMFDGEWFQTRPVDETPKCECGLDDVMTAFEKRPNEKE